MEGVHARLARLRDRSGLGLRTFARVVNDRTGYEVSHTTVSSYESGGTVPVGYAVAVSDAFDVNCRWLVTGEGPERGNGAEVFFRRHPRPVLALDGEELRVLATNEAFRRRFGGDDGEGASPGRLLFLLHPDDRARARAAFGDPDSPTFDARVRCGDGYRESTLRHFRVGGTVFCVLLDAESTAQDEVELTADRERTGP